jgi:hypothetical protein
MMLVSVLLVVGCKRYDEQKLRAVCDGTGYEAAAAYDPNSASARYPLAMTYKSPHVKDWYLHTPVRFQAATTAPSKDNYRDVALALCIEQQPGPFDRDCQMDSFDSKIQVGGGAPKVDVKKSERGPATIKAHGSHYILTMREAKTGTVVATKTVDVKVEACPMLTLGGYPDDYAEIRDEDLVAFAAPALPNAVGAKLLTAAPP